MAELTGAEAVAAGLSDAGVCVVTALPGVHARPIAEGAGLRHYSNSGRNALAVAWGAAVCGARAAAVLDHSGLCDAANPFLGACALGTAAGLVVVVIDDADAAWQDSRPFSDFFPTPWLEPADPTHAYALARRAFALSERRGCLTVIRLTHSLCRARSEVGRAPPVPAFPFGFTRDPARWVGHPAEGADLANRLARRAALVDAWADGEYPVPTLTAGRPFRLAGAAAAGTGGPFDLVAHTLPLPPKWLRALREAGSTVEVSEHGRGHLAAGVAAALAEDRVLLRPAPRPASVMAYRETERFEPLFTLVRALPIRTVVADLGEYTLDQWRTVDLCLNRGDALAVATGAKLATPGRHVIAVTDAETFHLGGRLGLAEAGEHGAALGVVVLADAPPDPGLDPVTLRAPKWGNLSVDDIAWLAAADGESRVLWLVPPAKPD